MRMENKDFELNDRFDLFRDRFASNFDSCRYVG